MAYVLGFFAADGTMIHSKRGGHYIEFHINDKEILIAIQRVVGSNHKMSIRKRRDPNQKTGYRIQFGSKEMYTDLTALGMCSRKSLTLQMPWVPPEYFSHFVRGYFDGDGCVYFKKLKFADRKRKRYILQSLFSCGTFDFLAILLKTLRTYGVVGGSLKKKKHGNELVFSHHDSIALYRIMYNNLRDSDIYLGRKYMLFTHAIETLYGKDAAVV